ncbi:MAG: DoxX family protein [Corynebacterium sp.]|nr:DoxX family protein [Corynebacterium sp.]
MDKPVVRDGALLFLRLVLGIIFIAHGWDRMFIMGLEENTGQFSALGVPQPELSTWIVTVSELLGGSLLVVGFLCTFVAGAMALLMSAATYFVHLNHGLFVAEGGFEYTLLLVAALFIVVVFGSGRASIDGVLNR